MELLGGLLGGKSFWETATDAYFSPLRRPANGSILMAGDKKIKSE